MPISGLLLFLVAQGLQFLGAVAMLLSIIFSFEIQIITNYVSLALEFTGHILVIFSGAIFLCAMPSKKWPWILTGTRIGLVIFVLGEFILKTLMIAGSIDTMTFIKVLRIVGLAQLALNLGSIAAFMMIMKELGNTKYLIFGFLLIAATAILIPTFFVDFSMDTLLRMAGIQAVVLYALWGIFIVSMIRELKNKQLPKVPNSIPEILAMVLGLFGLRAILSAAIFFLMRIYPEFFSVFITQFVFLWMTTDVTMTLLLFIYARSLVGRQKVMALAAAGTTVLILLIEIYALLGYRALGQLVFILPLVILCVNAAGIWMFLESLKAIAGADTAQFLLLTCTSLVVWMMRGLPRPLRGYKTTLAIAIIVLGLACALIFMIVRVVATACRMELNRRVTSSS